MRLTFIALSL
ncbi:unnamed protein product, partial [Rotaria sordida]